MGEEEEQEEEFDTSIWMITFSDLLSLLLTFFVLLFALKALDKGKLEEFLGYFRGGGMGVLEAGKEMPVVKHNPIDEIAGAGSKPFTVEELNNMIRMTLKRLNIEDKISVHSDERGLILTLSDVILFDSGSSDIKPEAKFFLDKLSEIFRKDNRYEVMIEGHTDDRPISTEKFPSNWELSTDRAVRVLRYFVEVRKLPPERFSAVGYADTRPLLPNTSPENRRRNRRVEIILVPPSKAN